MIARDYRREIAAATAAGDIVALSALANEMADFAIAAAERREAAAEKKRRQRAASPNVPGQRGTSGDSEGHRGTRRDATGRAGTAGDAKPSRVRTRTRVEELKANSKSKGNSPGALVPAVQPTASQQGAGGAATPLPRVLPMPGDRPGRPATGPDAADVPADVLPVEPGADADESLDESPDVAPRKGVINGHEFDVDPLWHQAAYREWTRKLGIIDYGRLRKALAPAMEPRTGVQAYPTGLLVRAIARAAVAAAHAGMREVKFLTPEAFGANIAHHVRVALLSPEEFNNLTPLRRSA